MMDTKNITPVKPKELKKRGKLKKVLIILIIIMVILGAGYIALQKTGLIKTFQLAYQMQKQQQLTAEDKEVLEQLKKIILLPDDVTPTMAVITDIDALKKQQPAFFADAKNGDRLIIYPNQAIIFDATANKIIKVGAVQFNNSQSQVQAVPFAIYNSTDDAGKLTAMKDKLTKAYNNAVVKVEGKSALYDYPQSILVDLSGNSTEAAKIAKDLGLKAASLPQGETAPEGVSFLIIIGQN